MPEHVFFHLFVVNVYMSASVSASNTICVCLRSTPWCVLCACNLLFWLLLFFSPVGNVRIMTAWGPDEIDLGVNELPTDRQRSYMHLN